MKPGVLKQLSQRHMMLIAAGQAELRGVPPDDLIAFAYTDLSAAQRYAGRNRGLGYTVIGPVQPGKNGSWVNVIVISTGRRPDAMSRIYVVTITPAEPGKAGTLARAGARELIKLLPTLAIGDELRVVREQ